MLFRSIVPNLYVMDLPQTKSAEGRALLRAEYERFKEAVEDLSGVKIDVPRLKRGIEIVNNKRKAIHRLAALRKADPVPISGLDALLINQVFFYDDPIRFTDSVNKICGELEDRIRDRTGVFPKATPRIVLSGCPMAVPNWKLPWIIETSGATIVGEESCVGERGTRNFTESTSDSIDSLMDAIADRYFQVDCAIFTPNPNRLDHVREMFQDHAVRAVTLEHLDHVREMFQGYGADGVIHYGLQFCQPYQIESLPVEKALEAKHMPVLRIDTDYSMEDVEQLKTRVEAFVERIREDLR